MPIPGKRNIKTINVRTSAGRSKQRVRLGHIGVRVPGLPSKTFPATSAWSNGVARNLSGRRLPPHLQPVATASCRGWNYSARHWGRQMCEPGLEVCGTGGHLVQEAPRDRRGHPTALLPGLDRCGRDAEEPGEDSLAHRELLRTARIAGPSYRDGSAGMMYERTVKRRSSGSAGFEDIAELAALSGSFDRPYSIAILISFAELAYCWASDRIRPHSLRGGSELSFSLFHRP